MAELPLGSRGQQQSGLAATQLACTNRGERNGKDCCLQTGRKHSPETLLIRERTFVQKHILWPVPITDRMGILNFTNIRSTLQC